jgi:hypothetical protein
MVRRLMLVFLAAAGLCFPALTPPTQAGAVDGPQIDTKVVRAYDTNTHVVRFAGGELAMVVVQGDGDTDLDLYVYDENGRLVGKDVGPSDFCVVTWIPRRAGTFTIRVVNLGDVYNRYTILTN